MATIIDSLTTEHALLSELFDEIGLLLPDLRTVPEVRLLSRLVEGVLSRHADVETNLAFAALDHAQAQNGQLTRLHQDHQEIDKFLHSATVATVFPDAVKLLKAGLAASRKHFRREEQTVFPLFEKLFDVADLEALGAAAPRRVASLGPHGFANALRGRLRNNRPRPVAAKNKAPGDRRQGGGRGERR